ncbi:MAG: hypothetical protein P8Z79_09285 [Sedimentisphaerales bacterium]|jgi:hypothetical protein
MNRKRAIVLTVVVIAAGGISFVGTRLAATASEKTERNESTGWMASASPSVVESEEKFNKEADGLIENLQGEQKDLALAIEDPCTPDASILAQVEKVITAHEQLLNRVGEHITILRSELPAAQRQRLMGLCAEVLRGPLGQGRGRGGGYGYGARRRTGWQNSSGAGPGPRGRGFGRGGGGGRGYGRRLRRRGGLAQRLRLTDEQILVAQEQDPNFEADLTGLRESLLTERTRLLAAFENPQTSNEELLEHIGKLISAHSQIERRLARYLLVLRPHLTAEQQKWLIGLCRRSGY